MFRQTISNTVFSCDAAGALMSNIYGDYYNGDVTFLSTLRALVFPRMPKDNGLRLVFSGVNVGTGEGYSARNVGRNIATICIGDFAVVNISGSDRAVDETMANLENYGQVDSDFVRISKVTDFFRKVMKVVAFIDAENKRSVAFIANLDMRKMHYLQTAILPLLPWYFTPEAGVTAEEMALIQSLREKTSDKYLEALNALAARYDFRRAAIEAKLKGFEKNYERERVQVIESQITDIDRQLDQLEQQIGMYLQSRKDTLTELFGLQAKLEDENVGDSELMEYFLCNKNLHLEDVRGTQVTFTVATRMSFFDTDMASTMLSRSQNLVSSAYPNVSSPRLDVAQMTKLFKAIFVEEKLKLLTCASYTLDIRRAVNANGSHIYPAELGDYLPNPHIEGYSCLGNYLSTINTLMRSCDYIGAVAQCVASAQSLNFGDGTVMRFFTKTMFTTRKHCIELPDGRRVEPSEAVEYLEQNEKDV